MNLCISLLLLGSVLPTEPLHLEYRGEVVQKVRGEDDVVSKRFMMTTVVTTDEVEAGILVPQADYIVEESGGGGWPWLDTYGRTTGVTPSDVPQLLFLFNETHYPINLRTPFIELPADLALERTWKSGDLELRTVGEKKVGEYDCWKIEVRDRIGLSETVYVDKKTELLVQMKRRVFVGRGDRFELVQTLASRSELEADELSVWSASFDQLLALKTTLNRTERSFRPELPNDALTKIETALKAIGDVDQESLLAGILKVASNDVASQKKRMAGVDGLRQTYLNRPAGKLDLTLLDGKKLDSKLTSGHPVLLHFWLYRDEPLTEPYGQVGYLDFLQKQCKRRKFDLQVIGVAVDPRFGDPATSPAAARTAERLSEFFRLSYLIVRDDGSLLKRFGDPRRIQARLPLWVLISSDGTIKHYHVGLHSFDRRRGLVDLEREVIELVKQERASEE